MLRIMPTFCAVLATTLCLSVQAVSSQAKPEEKPARPATHTYQPVPVTAARQVNPVKPTPESIAAGKKIYGYDCAQCHGENGNGKTRIAKEMKRPDLSDPATLKGVSDGEIYYVLDKGRGDMPREGDRVNSEQLWNLVNYERSLAAGEQKSEEKGKE